MKRLPVPLFRSDFRAMLKQQFLLLTRYPLNLTANFLLVLLMVIVVTMIVTIFAPEESETRLSGITLSGFIIYIFLTHTIWTVGLSIHKEQIEGTLTSFYLSPGSRFFFTAGPVAGGCELDRGSRCGRAAVGLRGNGAAHDLSTGVGSGYFIFYG